MTQANFTPQLDKKICGLSFSNLSAPRVSWSYESPGCLFACEFVAVSGQKCLIMGATHAAVESAEPKCPLQNY